MRHKDLRVFCPLSHFFFTLKCKKKIKKKYIKWKIKVGFWPRSNHNIKFAFRIVIERRRTTLNEQFAIGSVPVSIAAKVYGRDASWVRAGIVCGRERKQ